MHRASRALVLFAALSLAPRPALAAWPPDPYMGGLQVSGATGAQSSPRAIPDGAGGFIVAWLDSRSGGSDVYAQRVNAAGIPQWTADGVAVCTATNDQIDARVVSDGAGGVIVGWSDFRSGSNYDIYVQRLNASGVAQWTANGVLLCGAANLQRLGGLVPDGAGGAIATWYDIRSAANYDVYARRVNSSGTAQWTSNGVALCTSAGDQDAPAILSDGAGGAIVAWEDDRSGVADIYVQRVNGSGATQWTANGVALCTLAGLQWGPVITTDGAGGAIVAWQDDRNGVDYDIYARRVSAAGTPLWSSNSIAATTATGNQIYPAIASDGSGGAIVAWQDGRAGSQYDIYAQRLTTAGAAAWTANGVGVCTLNDQQTSAAVLADGLGGAYVAWSDVRTGLGYDIHAQRLNPSGSAYWPSGGILVCGAVYSQFSPQLVTDDATGAFLVWGDPRNGNVDDIYAQRIERFGKLGNPEPAITQVKDVTGDQGGRVKVSWAASYLDAEPEYDILDYRVWRSVPATSLTAGSMLARGFSTDPDEAAAGDRFLVLSAAAGDYAWELAGTQGAALLPNYSFVTPTTRDSLGGSNPYTAFMVEARTGSTISADRWFSAPDSGYSVDNLAPAAPAPFAGTYSGGASVLTWNPNAEPDLAGYRLYRGASAAFVPGPGNLVTAQPDTGYVDAAGAPYWYKLTAVDTHGNESPVATLLPAGTTAVEAGAAARAFFAIGSANPVRAGATTTLRFGLATAGRASVALYDAGGRRVRELAAGTLEAGEHALVWDGRDETGRAAAPGLYFARFEVAGFAATRKLVVQD